VPPGEAAAAAAALERLDADPGLRDGLVERARERVKRHTLEAESARVAAFLAG
jgi:glycosyltransferase involved in cell wall biosynthesis